MRRHRWCWSKHRPTLRQVQAKTLAAYAPVWADSVADLPDQPLYLIANEFFDALPIDQFQRGRAGLAAVLLGVQGDAPDASACQPRCPAPTRALPQIRSAQWWKLCPLPPPIAAHIGALIRQHGGAAIIIDYGGWRSKGDTLQALRNHAPENPLANPGQADLTAHVDFEALARAAGPDMCSALTDQGTLLARLGIAARAARLAQGLSGSRVGKPPDRNSALDRPRRNGNAVQSDGHSPAALPTSARICLNA